MWLSWPRPQLTVLQRKQSVPGGAVSSTQEHGLQGGVTQWDLSVGVTVAALAPGAGRKVGDAWGQT